MDKQTLGGRHNKSGKNIIHVGKIFAEWCGHCKSLQPEWERMKRDIKMQLGRSLHNVHVEFVEIGDTEKNKAKGLTVDGMIAKYNASNKPSMPLASDGYPTLFKVFNGKMEYYTGTRDAKSMYAWYMKGVTPTGVISKRGGYTKKTRQSIKDRITGMVKTLPVSKKNRTRKSR
jgi:thiol-disulfide isomerase/thioredoxin